MRWLPFINNWNLQKINTIISLGICFVFQLVNLCDGGMECRAFHLIHHTFPRGVDYANLKKNFLVSNAWSRCVCFPIGGEATTLNDNRNQMWHWLNRWCIPTTSVSFFTIIIPLQSSGQRIKAVTDCNRAAKRNGGVLPNNRINTTWKYYALWTDPFRWGEGGWMHMNENHIA